MKIWEIKERFWKNSLAKLKIIIKKKTRQRWRGSQSERVLFYINPRQHPKIPDRSLVLTSPSRLTYGSVMPETCWMLTPGHEHTDPAVRKGRRFKTNGNPALKNVICHLVASISFFLFSQVFLMDVTWWEHASISNEAQTSWSPLTDCLLRHLWFWLTFCTNHCPLVLPIIRLGWD